MFWIELRMNHNNAYYRFWMKQRREMYIRWLHSRNIRNHDNSNLCLRSFDENASSTMMRDVEFFRLKFVATNSMRNFRIRLRSFESHHFVLFVWYCNAIHLRISKKRIVFMCVRFANESRNKINSWCVIDQYVIIKNRNIRTWFAWCCINFNFEIHRVSFVRVICLYDQYSCMRVHVSMHNAWFDIRSLSKTHVCETHVFVHATQCCVVSRHATCVYAISTMQHDRMLFCCFRMMKWIFRCAHEGWNFKFRTCNFTHVCLCNACISHVVRNAKITCVWRAKTRVIDERACVRTITHERMFRRVQRNVKRITSDAWWWMTYTCVHDYAWRNMHAYASCVCMCVHAYDMMCNAYMYACVCMCCVWHVHDDVCMYVCVYM